MANPNNEHIPTDKQREQVKLLSASGFSQQKVASCLGVSIPTLTKHYRDEYDNGTELMVNELLPVSFNVAKDPDHKDSSKERHFLLERKGGFTRTDKVIVEYELRDDIRKLGKSQDVGEAAERYNQSLK